MSLNFYRFAKVWILGFHPLNECMLKVNNRISRKRCEVFSNLTIETLVLSHLKSFLLTLNKFPAFF